MLMKNFSIPWFQKSAQKFPKVCSKDFYHSLITCISSKNLQPLFQNFSQNIITAAKIRSQLVIKILNIKFNGVTYLF